jgi:hypothetical protein
MVIRQLPENNDMSTQQVYTNIESKFLVWLLLLIPGALPAPNEQLKLVPD